MQFVNGDSDLSEKNKRDLKKYKISRSTLFLISVPPVFHNKEYGEVYDNMVLEHSIVPIGLLKGSLSSPIRQQSRQQETLRIHQSWSDDQGHAARLDIRAFQQAA